MAVVSLYIAWLGVAGLSRPSAVSKEARQGKARQHKVACMDSRLGKAVGGRKNITDDAARSRSKV